MKICLVYIAVTNGPITADYIARFAATYHMNPPGADHSTTVVCNGGPLSLELTLQLQSLNPIYLPRTNTPDYDIGGYLDAARGPCVDSEMMVCLGESIYFHREGWLKRLIEVWKKWGPGMYGSFSSNLVRSHINTTGFCAPTELLKRHPKNIKNRGDRYEFEHGKMAFWRRVWKSGRPVRLVTWDGDFGPREWRCPQNIMWRGNQSNCLMFCSHTDRYAQASPTTKRKWEQGADQAFK